MTPTHATIVIKERGRVTILGSGLTHEEIATCPRYRPQWNPARASRVRNAGSVRDRM